MQHEKLLSKDAIPLETVSTVAGPTENGMMSASFYAFNTVIALQAFGDQAICRAAFINAEKTCRIFERLLSRTLAHSDISRINGARGETTQIDAVTYDVLRKSLFYCEQSRGCFDITVGPAVRLWDFHEGIIADEKKLAAALSHINWQGVHLTCNSAVSSSADGLNAGVANTADSTGSAGDTSNTGNTSPTNNTNSPNLSANTPHAQEAPVAPRYFARLDDPCAAVDVGGTAKGYIADALADGFDTFDLSGAIINLGGNVVVRGTKPDGSPWRVGLQDPRVKGGIVGAVELAEGSAVTSGIYERCFEKNGELYHHILDPKTGHPVQTDVSGATVIADTSLDAEGFSTTLLALGLKEGIAFAASRPEIRQAYFIDEHVKIHSAK